MTGFLSKTVDIISDVKSAIDFLRAFWVFMAIMGLLWDILWMISLTGNVLQINVLKSNDFNFSQN